MSHQQQMMMLTTDATGLAYVTKILGMDPQGVMVHSGQNNTSQLREVRVLRLLQRLEGMIGASHL